MGLAIKPKICKECFIEIYNSKLVILISFSSVANYTMTEITVWTWPMGSGLDWKQIVKVVFEWNIYNY